MVEELLTPAEVSERCKVSTKTVLRAIHGGRLRAARLGTRSAYRIRPVDIEEWIENSRVIPQPRPAKSPVLPADHWLLNLTREQPLADGRLAITKAMSK